MMWKVSAVSISTLVLAGCAFSGPRAKPSVSASPANVETGTHWARPSDFPILRRLGYDFAIATVDPRNRTEWVTLFDAAEASGLKLIAGAHPPPYTVQKGEWTISGQGQSFLRYAASRAGLVKAIFVFNEPYWIDPFTEKSNYCGALSAGQLRDLRAAIRRVWAQALVYHDIGHPSRWAPGGRHRRFNPCIGDKYADATGVADFVGIWSFPFETSGYHKRTALEDLRRETEYVTTRMKARPIIANQAFRCGHCGEATRWPAVDEMKDWNCATRALGPHAVSWYPWRQDIYDDFLANHEEAWQSTTSQACR
jgi:hypothetical protein